MKMALESNLSSIMWVFAAFITFFMFFVSLMAQSYVMATDMITTSIQIEAVTSEAACNTVVGLVLNVLILKIVKTKSISL